MPRFYQAPQWHLVVTDRQSEAITLLDRLATDRTARYELGVAATFSGLVPSDNPEVNILHDDGFANTFPFQPEYPFLAEGVRFLYALRGDYDGDAKYNPRFSGMILETDDAADTDRAVTRFTAYDPWEYLYHRPVRNTDGELPGPSGLRFLTGTTLDEVLLTLLQNTIDTDGSVHIDAGVAWSGTAFFGGTIQTLHALTEDLIFQVGTTVGEAWKQIVDTSSAEIHLRPIYDPQNRPGYLVEFNCYDPSNFGDYQPPWQTEYPLMAWDRAGHTLTSLGRLVDGRERANKIDFYGGLSGGGVPLGVQTNAQSVTRFGQYWAQEQLTRRMTEELTRGTAYRELSRRVAGRRTWSASLAPEHEIIPFRDFDLGYILGLYHSKRFREDYWEYHRLLGFTLNLGDDEPETVTDMLLSVDDTDYPTLET